MAALNSKIKAIFYDDAEQNVDQVNKACAGNIASVLIPTSPRFPPINLEENVYYKIRQAAALPNHFYDSKSGIQQSHVDQLEGWARTGGRGKHVYFDWDFTLSMCEGLYFPSMPPGLSISQMYKVALYADYTNARIYEDMLLYLMGGAERLALLRHMFTFLKKAGVRVTILTNNPICADEERKGVFHELVFKLAGHRAIKFICGAEERYGYDKGLAMKTEAAAVCLRAAPAGRCSTRRSKGRGKTKKRRVN